MYLLLFSSAVWLHSMMAATAIPTLLNSIRPDDDRSDLRGNSFTVVGASIPRSTNTRCTVSSVKSGGVLKKWTIFEGGCILFLLAIAGFRNLESKAKRKTHVWLLIQRYARRDIIINKFNKFMSFINCDWSRIIKHLSCLNTVCLFITMNDYYPWKRQHRVTQWIRWIESNFH